MSLHILLGKILLVSLSCINNGWVYCDLNCVESLMNVCHVNNNAGNSNVKDITLLIRLVRQSTKSKDYNSPPFKSRSACISGETGKKYEYASVKGLEAMIEKFANKELSMISFTSEISCFFKCVFVNDFKETITFFIGSTFTGIKSSYTFSGTLLKSVSNDALLLYSNKAIQSGCLRTPRYPADSNLYYKIANLKGKGIKFLW